MLAVAAFACGFIFGWGLLISGMVQPAKVLAFLDIFGTWDASLAVVMAAALAVSGLGFALIKQRQRPILAAQVALPSKTEIDAPLVTGAALFGVGWGLVGLCPGPALENLASLSPRLVAFVIAMAAGMVLHDLWSVRAPIPQREAVPAAADG